MLVKFQLLSPSGKKPSQMSKRSSGHDLYSSNTEAIILQSGEIKLIETGIAIGLSEGYEAQVRPRSGLALRHGIGVLNAPGTIDSDYRGEIKVILFNFGKEEFVIEPGTRIAQLVIARYEKVEFTEVTTLEKTKRGTGGFGHTGVK